MQRLALAAMGSVVESGGGDLLSGRNTSKWNKKQYNNKPEQSKRSQCSSSSIERTKITPYRP
jgi:hypothetical protein